MAIVFFAVWLAFFAVSEFIIHRDKRLATQAADRQPATEEPK